MEKLDKILSHIDNRIQVMSGAITAIDMRAPAYRDMSEYTTELLRMSLCGMISDDTLRMQVLVRASEEEGTISKFDDLKGSMIKEIIMPDDIPRHAIGRMVEYEYLGHVLLVLSDYSVYMMHHCQNCCEEVCLVDVCGDVDDVCGAPLMLANETEGTCDAVDGDPCGVLSWAFYNLATINGYVTLTFRGDSNGYYTLDMDFERVSLGNMIRTYSRGMES